MLRFTRFLEIFGQKKCFLGSKTVFLGQEVHFYMVYIAYYTELNFQICKYAQKHRICHENSKYALDENVMAIFALAERKAANFGHPVLWWFYKFYKNFFDDVPFTNWDLIISWRFFLFSLNLQSKSVQRNPCQFDG